MEIFLRILQFFRPNPFTNLDFGRVADLLKFYYFQGVYRPEKVREFSSVSRKSENSDFLKIFHEFYSCEYLSQNFHQKSFWRVLTFKNEAKISCTSLGTIICFALFIKLYSFNMKKFLHTFNQLNCVEKLGIFFLFVREFKIFPHFWQFLSGKAGCCQEFFFF